jgi:FkbM family methyltransferase
MKEYVRNKISLFLNRQMEHCLKNYANAHQELKIIQVGANDGKKDDYMHALIKRQGTQAIVIEPSPYTFSLLQKTYKDYPDVRPVNIAITDDEAELSKIFYCLQPKEGEHFDDRYTLWSSFNLDHLKHFRGGVSNFDTLLTSINVTCKTINKVFGESSFGELDILATDTEGFDHHIINRIDFSVFKPKMILFEHYHAPKPALKQLLKKLSGMGYRCYSQRFDTLCVHPLAGHPDQSLKRIKNLKPSLYTPPV